MPPGPVIAQQQLQQLNAKLNRKIVPGNFDHFVYIMINPDVRNLGIKTKHQAIAHWKQNGGQDNPRKCAYTIPFWRRPLPIKLAICISGFMRNYRLLPRSINFKRLIQNHQVDIYISTWDIIGYSHCGNPQLDYRKLNVANLKTFASNIKAYEVENYDAIKKSGIFATKIPATNVLREEPGVLERIRSQFYKVMRCNDMMLNSGIQYNAVIRMRPDLHFQEEIDIGSIMQDIESHKIFLNTDPCQREGVFGDQFALGNMYTITAYAHIYKRLYQHEFLSKNIPKMCEKLIPANLNDYRIEICKHKAFNVSINRAVIGTPKYK